jgi:Domain of unknown function (DUF1963)
MDDRVVSDFELAAEIAGRHLPANVAGRWLELLRPAAALRHARPGDRVAAVLGGQPQLPGSIEWPAWADHGPLSFIASIDCAALTAVPLDITLPQAGTLLFFYFDGQYGNYATTVGYWDPATLAGARVLHVPAGQVTSAQPCPEGITPYQRVDLAAEPVMTFPGFEHPDLHAVFNPSGADLRSFLGHPVNDQAFTDALAQRRPGPVHQAGGYADPLQGPVEYEAARFVLGSKEPDPDQLAAELARWTLLAQIDSDNRAEMMWGDCGALYWLTLRGGLADGGISSTSFTWQCA